MTGVELQLRYQPSDRTLINAHYAYTDVDSSYVFTYDPVLSTNDHNDRVPRHKAELLVHQKIAGVFQLKGLESRVRELHTAIKNHCLDQVPDLLNALDEESQCIDL